MKKLFTIDDFMVAFIAAMGYGYGEAVANHFGCSPFICVLASFAVGIAFEEIISKIVFSKKVQSKPGNRIFAFVAIFVVFLAAQYISLKWLGVSLISYLEEEFAFAVGLPIIGFVVNLLIRAYHIKKIRGVYGDGSKGYVFDVDKEEIDEINGQNRPITGEYDADLAVKTRTGIYVGEGEGELIYYNGIPYAKPPVGNLRWKAPEPLPSSDAVFEAKNFGASAIQVEHDGVILKHHRQSEDCLYLNISVSNQKEETKKPVIVWFHNGDFSFGGTADPLMDCTNYINRYPDTVFVSFTSRLGIFGYIDFSEVPGGEAYPDAINLGLLDQIAALRWIKENIAAFGGDPNRVTVIGFEAGAISIALLAASKEARGLFSKALVFVGDPGVAYDSPEGARRVARDLLNETQTSTMEELTKLDTETLKNAAQRLWKDMCTPTRDGALIPVDVFQAYKEGVAAGIEFIIGIPSSESRLYRAFIGPENYERIVAANISDIESYTDSTVEKTIREFLETETASTSEQEAKSKLMDQWIALRTYRSAAKLSEGGNKVHLMYWDEKAVIEKLGSGSVDVAAALLGNNEGLEMYGSVINKDLSEILQSLLHKFIRGEALKLYNNEIKGVDAFAWKAYPQAMVISEGRFSCEKILDKLTQIEGLADYVIQ